MTATATVRPTSTLEHESTGVTLADEHEDLLCGVQRRASAVRALIDARAWPHSELATLTGFLRATLLRQLSDEEHLLYPHDATAAPFAELSAAHAQLYDLTYQLEQAREQHWPLARVRELVDELLSRLRTHLAAEEAVLAALGHTELEVPAAATLGEQHEHWAADADAGPLVILFDDLPTAVATQLCVERLLRLRPGEQAVVYSRDRTRLYDVRAWLQAFDAARFAVTTASDRHWHTRLDVRCRDPR